MLRRSKLRKLSAALITAIVVLLSIPACASELESPTALPAGDSLAVREGPGAVFDSLFTTEGTQAVKVVGQQDDCAWLKIETDDELQGWVPASSLVPDTEFSCASLPLGTYRAHTEVLQRPLEESSMGELSIDNGTLSDGIAILTTLDEASVATAYIRDGDSVDITGIPDGTYYLFFSAGTEWDGNRFTEGASYQRFDETFAYSTTTLGYSTWSVTLHPVSGGNASTESVDPEQFPNLGNE